MTREPMSHETPDIPKEKERPSHEREDVVLPTSHLKIGDRFAGSTGEYEFVEVSDLLKEDGNCLDSVVRDAEGRMFFMHPKNPEAQAVASVVGRYAAEKLAPEMAGFRFPDTRLETVNGDDVLLMEYFDGYEELEGPDALPPEAIAYLNTINLWMGNGDFKPEHVLADPSGKGSYGLIDFDRAFNYQEAVNAMRRPHHFPFRDDPASTAAYRQTLERLRSLTDDDRDELVARAVAAGVKRDTAEELVGELFDRRGVLADELQTVRDRQERP